MGVIRQAILKKGKNVLNVYFTAGYPNLESTVPVITQLESRGVDLIELGMPYSDPLADGATIQRSSEIALKNGMTISLLFDQVRALRKLSSVPVILMGYYNQMLQYGPEKFLKDAAEAGINGLIIPDLPLENYDIEYKTIFDKYNMEISFLITPLTSDERIRRADELSSGFLYVVSQSSVTGKNEEFSLEQIQYFKRIQNMNLQSPKLIGFGIHNAATKSLAGKYAEGVIIGSAFIRALEGNGSLADKIDLFMESLV